MTTVLAAERIHGLDGASGGGWIVIKGGTIREVGEGAAPGGAENLSGYLIPGLIDLQVNGIGDVNFADAGPDDWARARGELLAHGVTGFCPTFVSAPLDSYSEKIEAAKAAFGASRDGASVLGFHLEGPFLGTARGAHRGEFIRAADKKWINELLHSHPDQVVMVTLAPEADPDCEVIRLLSRAGVLVALGHSTASYEQARAGADAGARGVTHLFNAMAPFHHRDPGLAGAALDDDRLTPTLIADLIHVHPAALRVAISRKPNVALVSDSVATGSETARELGVSIVDGAPRLADGTLAGSVVTLDVGVANLASIGVPLERAVEMASTVPAEMLGLTDRGRIKRSMRADLVLLEPESFGVLAVWLEDTLVHG